MALDRFYNFLVVGIVVTFIRSIHCNNNITKTAFGGIKDALPAAYGDFNSDELTDIFILTAEQKVVQILYGTSDSDLLLRPGPQCRFDRQITGVVPGDFDGDAFMDIMVTLRHNEEDRRDVHIIYGSGDSMNCSEKAVIEKMKGEPLALDYNHDMIIDLFGLDHEENRKFWIFSNRTEPKVIEMPVKSETVGKIKIPHSHAILDLNDDFIADLVISCVDGYEVWEGLKDPDTGFKFNHTIVLKEPKGALFGLLTPYPIYGQAVFTDLELKGEFRQLVPTCWDKGCNNASFLVSGTNSFHNLPINLKDSNGNAWGFAQIKDSLYENTISVRVGDFNLDGYPDLLATLENTDGERQVFLLENVQCFGCRVSRTFAVKWNALSPFTKGTIQGSFYDFYQDGVLDVILVEKYNNHQYRPLAFRNSLDYDANFVKVIVLTGLSNDKMPSAYTPLGYRRRYYGTNLPGPRIEFKTTTQEGELQHGASPQLSQSAYFPLQLPYTVFGLGRTPNFVDSLTVGLTGREKTITQLIPNSQMIVVPQPLDQPEKWKAQLFVTPSKLILMSVFALGGICLTILIIIMGLHFKEKREDKLEKLAEAHRFHFDAM